eukprot:m.75345 g.75345  ORF g.75345 m.75345 type:complete len:398 (-) comp24775_c0_seq1:9-1202(-)
MQTSLTSRDFLMVGTQLYEALISGELCRDQLTYSVNKRTGRDPRSREKRKQPNSTIDPHPPHRRKGNGSWLCGGRPIVPERNIQHDSKYHQRVPKQRRSRSDLNFSGLQLVDWLCQHFDELDTNLRRDKPTEFTTNHRSQSTALGTGPFDVEGVVVANTHAPNKDSASSSPSDRSRSPISKTAGDVNSSNSIRTYPEHIRQRMRQISAQLVNAHVIAPTVSRYSRSRGRFKLSLLSRLNGIFMDDPTQQYEYIGVNLYVDAALRKRSRQWSRRLPTQIKTDHSTVNLRLLQDSNPNLTPEMRRRASDRVASFLPSSFSTSSKLRSNRVTPSDTVPTNHDHNHESVHVQHDNHLKSSSWDRWRDPAPVIFWDWYMYGQLPGGFATTVSLPLDLDLTQS